MVTVQSRTAPGARVPGSRASAPGSGSSAEDRFPAAYSLRAARLVSLKIEDKSWTVRPDMPTRVGLLTVPCTVTGCPGLATCGLTEVMPTLTRWDPAAAVRAPRAWATAAVAGAALASADASAPASAGPAASAGPPAISAANAHASTPRRASRGHAGLAGLGSRCVGH